jgi:hypothetical protein
MQKNNYENKNLEVKLKYQNKTKKNNEGNHAILLLMI